MIKTTQIKHSSNIFDKVDITVLDEHSKNFYTTGEKYILTKGTSTVNIILNENTSKILTIKAMTKTKIKSKLKIEEEYDEIELLRGSSIKLILIDNFWYIVASDGLKESF